MSGGLPHWPAAHRSAPGWAALAAGLLLLWAVAIAAGRAPANTMAVLQAVHTGPRVVVRGLDHRPVGPTLHSTGGILPALPRSTTQEAAPTPGPLPGLPLPPPAAPALGLGLALTAVALGLLRPLRARGWRGAAPYRCVAAAGFDMIDFGAAEGEGRPAGTGGAAPAAEAKAAGMPTPVSPRSSMGRRSYRYSNFDDYDDDDDDFDDDEEEEEDEVDGGEELVLKEGDYNPFDALKPKEDPHAALHYVDPEHWQDRWLLGSNPYRPLEGEPDDLFVDDKVHWELLKEEEAAVPPAELPPGQERINLVQFRQIEWEPRPWEVALQNDCCDRLWEGEAFDMGDDMYSFLDLAIAQNPEGWLNFVYNRFAANGSYGELISKKYRDALKQFWYTPSDPKVLEMARDAAWHVQKEIRRGGLRTIPDPAERMQLQWWVMRQPMVGYHNPDWKWKRVFGEVSDYDDWTEQAKGSVPGREGRDGGWSMPPGTVVKYPPPTPNLNS
eukprot:EG_transcript_7795